MTQAGVSATKVEQRLYDLVREKRIHSIALVGRSGKDKNRLAHQATRRLLCQKPEAPLGGCGVCQSCLANQNDVHPDYLPLLRPAKGTNTIDQLRKILVEVSLEPQLSSCKVIVIDLEGISSTGQNAILKSLEEPPSTVFFILLADFEKNIIPTVRSRVVSLYLTEESDVSGELSTKEFTQYAAMQEKACSFANKAPGLSDYDYMIQGLTLFKEYKDFATDIVEIFVATWQNNPKLQAKIARITIKAVEAINTKAVPVNHEIWAVSVLVKMRKDLR